MAKEVVDFMEGVVDKGKEQVAMEVTLINCPRDFVTIDASLPEDEMRKKRRKLFGEGQILDHREKKNGEEMEEIILKGESMQWCCRLATERQLTNYSDKTIPKCNERGRGPEVH